ncbi:MAG: M15 family peptidase, partial [Pseudomonadota bacterium]
MRVLPASLIAIAILLAPVIWLVLPRFLETPVEDTFGGPAVDSAARIEIENLRQQIEAMQERMTALEERPAAPSPSTFTPPEATTPSPGAILPGDGVNAIIDAY